MFHKISPSNNDGILLNNEMNTTCYKFIEHNDCSFISINGNPKVLFKINCENFKEISKSIKRIFIKFVCSTSITTTLNKYLHMEL